ncbi:MAG: glycosyltransferase family 9 protein [Nitrospirota bacterium]
MNNKEINSERILLIQLRRIGDVLMTTPAVRALKKRFPEAKITFLTESPSDEIFRHNPYIDEVLLHNRKWGVKDYLRFIRNLRQKRFDLVIDFFSNPRSAQIAFFSGAKYRLGFNFRGRAWFYTTKITLPADKNLYSPLHKLLLLKPLGISAEDYRIEFFCSSADYKYAEELTHKLGISKDDFIVAVCPVSRRQYRVWQPEKFAMVCDKLIERHDAKILFMWGHNEEYFITQIKSRMKHPDKTLDNYDIPTLSQVRALFERVTLYTGTDNGLRHIAIAAHTPTVTVFGQSNPYNWIPPNDKLHKFVAYDPGCKKNCNLAKCKNYLCITEVSETEYLAKIEELIKEVLAERVGFEPT